MILNYYIFLVLLQFLDLNYFCFRLLPAAKIEYKKKLLRWPAINKMGPEKRKAYRKGVKNAQEVPEERYKTY